MIQQRFIREKERVRIVVVVVVFIYMCINYYIIQREHKVYMSSNQSFEKQVCIQKTKTITKTTTIPKY